jgi:hypothetical protein
MPESRTTILSIDGAINLVLGLLLVVFPERLVDLLGIPSSDSAFYPNILGGVLFGIGIALLLERNNNGEGGIGLGLAGAIAINLVGGLVLAGWLTLGNLELPMRGFLFLWCLVLVLVGTSAIEISIYQRKRRYS